MAHQWLRCNLLTSDFPLLTDLFGESVALKGLDQQTEQNDAQLFYCENVIPTSAGYQAVNFINRNPNGAASALGHGNVIDVYNLTYADPPGSGILSRTYMAPSVTDFSGLYVYEQITDQWKFLALPGAPGAFLPFSLSTASVAGQTYICPINQGIFHYVRTGAPALLADAVIGITGTSINGICGSNGLMIAWSSTQILWSSDQNPLDFTPSLVTGAGGGSVGEVKGGIVYCAPIAGGFMIYATENIVQASYTGNVSFPFKFEEVPGSGGVRDNNQIGFHDNADSQFAWTDKGLQSTQVGQIASTILPKLSEFLGAGYYETFDPATANFTKITVDTSQFLPNINFIGSRWLTISYGQRLVGFVRIYDYTLIIDTETGRVGRTKFTHVDTLDWEVDDGDVIAPTKRIGFITLAGLVETIDFTFDSPSNNEGNGLLVIGKFQLQRNKGVFHQRTKAECTYFVGDNPFTIYALPTLDGKNFLTPVRLTSIHTPMTNDAVRIYGKKVYGLNISLLIQGPFNLSSLQVDLTLGGSDRSYG